MTRFFSILITSLLLTLLTACATTPAQNPANDEAAVDAISTTVEDTNEASAADFPRTIIDNAGREVTVEQPPQKFVTYYNDSFGMLATFDVMPIGQDVDPEMLIDPIYFDGAGEDIASISGEEGIDLEKVAALQPDMVMVYADEEAQAIEAIAPAFVTPDPVDLEGVYEAVRLYGALLGREADSETAIAAFQDRLDAYKALAPDNVSILLAAPDEDNLGSVSIRTSNSPDCMLLNEIARCDWPNIVDDSWSYVATPEALLELNPDFIYYKSDWDSTLEELDVYIQSDPLWAELDAVQDGQLLHIVGYGNPIASSLPAATKLLDTFATLLYPDIFPEPLTDEDVQEIVGNNGDASAANFPLTITDGVGRELTFEKPPERVVALWNGNFGQMAALGVYPVATNADEDWLRDSTYYLADAASIPSIEAADGSIDLELVASYAPDLILGLREEEAQQLEGIAPVFVNAGLNFQEIDAYKENLRILGRIFAEDDSAETAIADFENRLNAYKSVVENETKPTVLISRAWGDQVFYVYTVATAACLLLDEVAACEWEHPSGDGSAYQTSYEGILSLNPDIVLLGHNSGFTDEDIANLFTELEENQLWNELDAVKNERVVYVEGYENQGVNNLASAVKFLDIIVPNLYPDFFDGPLTNEEVQEILALR